MPRFFFIAFFLLLGSVLSAQTMTRLHLLTRARNHLPGFPNFHFKVNGESFTLRAGQCLETTVTADSIHIEVQDKRLAKKPTEDLHFTPDQKDIYVLIRVNWTGNYRNPVYGADLLCKGCFEAILEACKFKD